MSQNLRNYTKAVYALDAVVQRMTPEQWDRATPCTDWNAREVLGHVMWGMSNVASMADGSPGPAPQPEAEVAGADPAATWQQVRDRVVVALDHPGALQAGSVTPFGEMSVDDMLAFHQFDLLAHAWDIGTGCDIDPCLPADLAEAGVAGMAAMGDGLRGPGAMGPAVEVPADADAATRFVAITGRRP